MIRPEFDRRLLLALGFSMSAAPAMAAEGGGGGAAGGTSAARDFDFMAGEWDVTNRQLNTRNAGSNDWEIYPSHETCQLLMNGMVSVDVATFPTRGIQGTTIRLYHPARDEWAAYWISSRDGMLQPPVWGRFRNGKGVFAGDDTDGDKPIKVRFEWTATDTSTPRWSQAFSYDGGQTWETNWIMDFRRRPRASAARSGPNR